MKSFITILLIFYGSNLFSQDFLKSFQDLSVLKIDMAYINDTYIYFNSNISKVINKEIPGDFPDQRLIKTKIKSDAFVLDRLSNEVKEFQNQIQELENKIQTFSKLQEDFDSAKKAIAGTHALFISSDCEEFRGFSRTIEDTIQPPYLVMDGRRMIPDYAELVAKDYAYLAVGSMAMKPKIAEEAAQKVKLKSLVG